MDTSREKRVDERDVIVSWQVCFMINDETAWIKSEISDCSSSGAFLRADENICAGIKTGDLVCIRGKLWNIPFHLDAHVRWVGKSQQHQCSGFGVRFEGNPIVFKILSSSPPAPPDAESPMDP